MIALMECAMAPHLFWSIAKGKSECGRDLWRINPTGETVGYGTAISEAGAKHTLDAIVRANTIAARGVDWC